MNLLAHISQTFRFVLLRDSIRKQIMNNIWNQLIARRQIWKVKQNKTEDMMKYKEEYKQYRRKLSFNPHNSLIRGFYKPKHVWNDIGCLWNLVQNLLLVLDKIKLSISFCLSIKYFQTNLVQTTNMSFVVDYIIDIMITNV